jgi:WD40-like Beta Propeller Repeat
VSRLEERLRDAYRGAADTVIPDTVRDLGEPAVPRPGSGPRPTRWWRGLTPLAAAAAVTVIAVLAAVLPKPSSQDQQSPAPAAAPRFLIADPRGGSPLEVRDAATGALVATVTLPTEPGSQAPTGNPAADGRTYIGSVATADGYHYVVSLYRLNHCRSWLYQFRLNAQGQPSAVRPLAALPTVGAQLLGLTVSGDGQMIGYTTSACTGSGPQPFYVAVTDIRTGQTKRWSTPAAGRPSLTADGSMLYYTINLSTPVVRGMPTSVAPGPAADRSRTVVRAAAFGPADLISFAAISPDGSTLYFATYPEGRAGPGVGQIRALNLATGRPRVVYTPAGQPGLVTADPAVQNFLLQIQQPGTTPPRLARLDLATGRVTDLPSGWLGPFGSVLTW